MSEDEFTGRRARATRRGIVGLVAVFASLAGPLYAQVDFKVSCTAPARAEFDRALTLLHHMTYPAAREGFERVAALDSTCAMAHWGIAMTLFQPLWPSRPGAAELQQGLRALAVAEKLGPGSLRESSLLAAAAAFFAEPGANDYWLRIRRWEAAMAVAYRASPDDPDIASLYALAHLAVAPADSGALAFQDRAAALLLGVHAHHPGHPGAHHYLVHANDAPGRAGHSPDIISNYEVLAPSNPHALHMPTHIHVRNGDWAGVIRGNRLAADAALAHPAGDMVWDEFPHAIEYLVYAELQQGNDAEALRQLNRMLGTEGLQPTFKTAFHLASTQARMALEQHDWEAAIALPVRHPASLTWDRYPWPEAVTWFAKGLGAAHLQQLDTATAAHGRLKALEGVAARSGERLFSNNIQILALELRAWIAQGQGHEADAINVMREAAELERTTPKHPVTPAPTLPALELLGDLFSAQSRPAEALAAYQQSLTEYPGRFNSMLGAARAAVALNDRAASSHHYQALLKLAAGSARIEVLKEAQAGAAPENTSFTVQSQVLGEPRLINVFVPAGQAGHALPVLYMPDGGLDEDFPHVIATVDSLIAAGLIRPVMVVGIPNTQRRRDLSGPTTVASDSTMAPRVGESAAFRWFIRTELIPQIERRYATTAERAIIGESLAGLFVIETMLEEPELFRHYIALDPSVWWNNGRLVESAANRLTQRYTAPRSLYLATSHEPSTAEGSARLAATLRQAEPQGLRWTYVPRVDLEHATIFRALKAAALIHALH